VALTGQQVSLAPAHQPTVVTTAAVLGLGVNPPATLTMTVPEV